MAVAIAAIECGARAAPAQMRKRRQMRARKIADVDVIADAGSVGRRIIRAEDLELGAASERGFAGDLDQMRGRRRCLASTQLRVGAGDVEVAQHDEVETMRA